MELDKSKDYAETMGDSEARYHQNGRDYDANGQEISKIIAEVVETPAKRRGRPPKDGK